MTGKNSDTNEVEVEILSSDNKDSKKTWKKKPNSVNGLIIGILELIVGILLFIKPVEFTQGIIIAFGVIMTIVGLISAIEYFRLPAPVAAHENTLVTSLILMIVGLFCACNSSWFITTFPAITVLYGIIILFVGLSSVQDTIDMIRMKNKRWFLPCILSILAIVFSILIFVDPFGSTSALWTFVAVCILIEAVIEITTCCVKMIKTKKNK